MQKNIRPNPITVSDLIKQLKKVNEDAIVYIASDPEQNEYHDLDRFEPISYFVSVKTENGVVEYKTHTDKIIIQAWANYLPEDLN